MRTDLISVYVEAEATFKYLSEYALARDSVKKAGYGEISDVITGITASRKQIEALPDNYVEVMFNSFRDARGLTRLANGLRKLREDADLQSALERSEKLFSSDGERLLRGETVGSNARSAPSAPAFIRPVCHFDDLNNYPSATDVGIAKGFAFLAEIVTLLIPTTVDVPILGVKIPFVARAIAAIAWGALEAIAIGLENARDEGSYCSNLAITIQSALTTDGTFVASLMLPRSAGGFVDFLQDYVTAAIQNATSKGIPVNCASTRLTEANNFYNANNWTEAYKKYRSAYQNINANTCIQ
ncbi:MAG: hypothetical protein JST85_24105 [Acidobacteria bacterium]|nr:hypothetical protein [Acidobacteriota bacterium]